MSQFVAEEKSGNRKAVLASNSALCIKLIAQHAKQLNYTTTLISFDTQRKAKVGVYVLQEVLRGYQSTRKASK